MIPRRQRARDLLLGDQLITSDISESNNIFRIPHVNSGFPLAGWIDGGWYNNDPYNFVVFNYQKILFLFIVLDKSINVQKFIRVYRQF